MQRNGKLLHPTIAVMEVLGSELQRPDTSVQVSDSAVNALDNAVQGTGSPAQGAGSSVQGAGSSAQGTGSPAQGTGSPARLSKQRINTYRADDAIDRRLMAARMTIETLLGDPKLAEDLSPYGYPMLRILEGRALYQQALALVKQYRSHLGDQLTAADACVSAQELVHARYKRHVAFARLGLRDDRGAAQKLDLSARKRSQSGWVLQADQFYTNALGNPAIMAKLAGYSVTVYQLLEAQQQVAAVSTAIVTQQRYKHVTQESKQARDVALLALDRWMRDFLAVSRVALADQPQRLAQLGLAGS